jgi:23S rRNA pseudouridine1911/1915/1917 synthase
VDRGGARPPERRRPKKRDRPSPGDRVTVTLPAPAPSALAAEEIPLDVVYQDADLLVLNKAAGMVVHPAPGHATGTLVNALLHAVGDLSGSAGCCAPASCTAWTATPAG